MNIQFPPADDYFIKSKVEDGFYTNATELVRDAVRRLREADDGRYARLVRALEKGEEDIRKGRVETFTPELLEEIDRKSIQYATQGIEFDSDVCP